MTTTVPRRIFSAVNPTTSVERSAESRASKQGRAASSGNSAKSGVSLIARMGRFGFVAATLLALGLGVKLSALEQYTPSEGPGYVFGIIGGTLILVLLLYPLRKRFKFMNRFGSAPAWFRVHMVLGIAGPVLILFHSNFSLGATNSNVALFAMLIVALSGVVGRYIYGKIHNGLYGARTELQDLLGNATLLVTAIEQDAGGANGAIAKELTDFGARALRPGRSIFSSLVQAMVLPFSIRFARTRILSAVRKSIRSNAESRNWARRERRIHFRQARLHVLSYLDGIVKASQLTFYEKLFGLWHVLHIPLFFLFIITGVVHVIAVHLY
jgi:hypothetical protein